MSPASSVSWSRRSDRGNDRPNPEVPHVLRPLQGSPRSRCATVAGRLLVQPALLIVSEIRNGKLRPPFRASHHIQTRIRRDSCQPPFERATTFKAPELSIRFQKNFLRRFFDQTALAKKAARKAENARAVAPHDFGKRGFVLIGAAPRQFQIG